MNLVVVVWAKSPLTIMSDLDRLEGIKCFSVQVTDMFFHLVRWGATSEIKRVIP